MATFKYALILFLTSCMVTPDYESGSNSWRFGVPTVENGNTGKLTRYDSVYDIPVIKVSFEQTAQYCGQVARACYLIAEDQIILARRAAGDLELIHERFHALYGRKHTLVQGYAISANPYWDGQDWTIAD